ncbi:MAG: FkbM family methyltransferase, partial [Betaproteobacteria bacterium]
MLPTTTLSMFDGVRVVVPDSIDLITPYVLLEQQDWFEDEIKFLRRLLQPGHRVIDIGANYGLYTLSMARTVGPLGCVWAFEPAADTAKLLAEGIAANDFSHVILETVALSSQPGEAQLSLNVNSELNSLVRGERPAGATETVRVSTLDACCQRFAWSDITFVKIDAEGEEAKILEGGRRFFADQSPLVQYEVKHGSSVHFELVERFRLIGYDSYRLIPGLDLLVPFGSKSIPDEYLLNLFCCKADRAEQLAAGGHLLDSKDGDPGVWIDSIRGILSESNDSDSHNWRQTLAKMPYGETLAALWRKRIFGENDTLEVDKALTLYACSRDSALSQGQRYGALEGSLELLEDLCERNSTYLRQASLARVARDCGARMLAVNTLQKLCNRFRERQPADMSEPFLAPSERFDSLRPGESLGDWVLAGALEELERLGSFSSFYTGLSAKGRLET